MSIRKSLGNLVIACGGTPTAKSVRGLIGNIAEALGGSASGKTVAEQIDNIALVKDPLFGLTVDADIDETEDLLGKTVDDLQSDITIRNGVISGKLKYVDGYTEFSGDPEMQNGHYLVLHASVLDVDNAIIKAKVTREVTLDSDGLLIIYIVNGRTQTVTFTATKDGYADVAKTYKLDLQLEDAPAEE